LLTWRTVCSHTTPAHGACNLTVMAVVAQHQKNRYFSRKQTTLFAKKFYHWSKMPSWNYLLTVVILQVRSNSTFQESHWGEDDHGYPYAHQYSNERCTCIYDVNYNDDWYNQYHYPQQKLEGYWPSYNYEADVHGSSQQESSQYEEYESSNADSLIEEDEDSVVHDDGFSQ
jgi:hypothetical protein